MSDVRTLAARFFAAIEAGDIEAVRGMYAPDAVIWHNYDGIEQSPADNLQTLSWMVGHLKDIQYDEVRCDATENGFVQRHVLRATKPDGTPFEIPGCLVAAVDGDQITRIDEYLDSVQIARIV